MRLIIPFLVLNLFCGLSSNAQTTAAQENCFELPATLVKNNDDQLTIKCKCDLSEFSFKLFNRWGSLMYESKMVGEPTDLNINETSKGQEKFHPGTYFWTIDYRKVNQAKKSSITGFINIL